MKPFAMAVAMTLLSSSPVLQAQEQPAASLIKAGVDAYLKEGAAAGLRAWLKGSPAEGNAEALSQANVLKQIEELYGKFEGHDIISNATITSRVNLIYFVLYYEKGVVYCNFEIYKLKQGQWVLGELNFHTKSEKILPEQLRITR